MEELVFLLNIILSRMIIHIVSTQKIIFKDCLHALNVGYTVYNLKTIIICSIKFSTVRVHIRKYLV